jgi:phosphohistidine phosphatase
MKELLLLRHAKSSWANPGQADIDRPLSRRGRRAATQICGWLAEKGLRPSLVLCSSSRRTRETLDLLHEALGPQVPVHLEPALYLADPASLLARLRRVPAGIPSIMLIGHNPGLQELALEFTRSARSTPSDIRDRLMRKFPTAGLLRLRIAIDDWSQLATAATAGTIRTLSYVTPADLEAVD